MSKLKTPTTLQEAVLYFSDRQNCLDYIAAMRWPNGVTCPVCGSKSVSYLKSVNRWQCSKQHAKRQFTAKTGTVFEDSPLGLDKWLIAMWLIVNAKNGISSYEIARSIDVTQKTGWFMLQRIRLAMQNGGVDKLTGEVEADETGIGGVSKNMHKHVRARRGIRMGYSDQTTVAGVKQRNGDIRLEVVSNTEKVALHRVVESNILKGSNLYKGYRGLEAMYVHAIVDHSYTYVVDKVVHTNGLENFWSLLKRTMRGTYVSVEPFHLFRYLDEYTSRFNNRKANDGQRFVKVSLQVSGKRLTCAEVTGKTYN